MDQYIGKLLDNRYEILERVGSGGMAVVYKARCHRLNRLVAIKILKTELAQDAEFRRRFHDESQAVAMLSHPNIVAVYDVSRSTELDYIVMELIDGITLKQYMQKKGQPLSWKESLHYITQIMKALSHAHSRGIIHRDIKPHNIMILRDGSVKVADFGIARLASAAQNTLTQEALGSVHYISPEQARGSHIDARSDIYSAGVVLYEMVTGRLPYEGDSPISVAIQHINSIPLSPHEVNPDIPEALEAITMKAMAANMDQRYASADDMLANLEEFRKNPNINFEYSAADLLTGADEPTQVMDTGSHNLHAAANAARAGASRGKPPESAVRRRRIDDDDEYDDDYSPRRRSDRGGALPIVLAVGVILIFLVAIGYFLWASFLSGLGETTPDFVVPDLTGMSVEEANDLPEIKAGTFTIEFGKTVINDGFKEGEIAFQDPASGSKRKEGTVITVDVNSGTTQFVMDDYTVTRRLSDIKVLLESKGFLVEVDETDSETVTQGYIISQDPDEGTKLKPGDTVKLVGSTGPKLKLVTVPVFINMTKDDAVKAIQSAGLIAGSVKPTFDETIPEGSVVWQSLQQGTEVPEKTVIDLKVSKGPDPTVIPSPTPSPSESVEPSPSPSPDVTPTPVPTPSESVNEVSKAITVYLPTDKDLVHVVIKVDGVVKWDDNVSASEFSFITPAVKGYGTQTVEVYIDDALTDTQIVDFT